MYTQTVLCLIIPVPGRDAAVRPMVPEVPIGKRQPMAEENPVPQASPDVGERGGHRRLCGPFPSLRWFVDGWMGGWTDQMKECGWYSTVHHVHSYSTWTPLGVLMDGAGWQTVGCVVCCVCK